MSWKSLTCVTVFCALLAGQAMAVPTLSVTPSAAGANTLWTVAVTPDPTLLAAGNGSMALELALEFPTAQTLVGAVTIDPLWMETINGVLIDNPGLNPYANGGAGGITFGIDSHPNVASEIGGAGNVNALFAALGSTKFTTTGPKTAFTFTTLGNTGMSVSWDGFLAQDPGPTANFFDVSGTATFPNTPQPAGDFSGDGAVDGDDLSLLLGNWGKTVPPTPTGWNGVPPTATLVDSDELSALLGTWGQGVGAGALTVSTAAVPEPASILSGILCLAGVGLFARRRLG